MSGEVSMGYKYPPMKASPSHTRQPDRQRASRTSRGPRWIVNSLAAVHVATLALNYNNLSAFPVEHKRDG